MPSRTKWGGGCARGNREEGHKMKRKLITLLAVVAVMSVMMAAPVSADGPRHHPFGGEQVMVLNQNDDGSLGLYGCEDISWFGTIELYGHTLGMALYSMGGYDGDDGLFHYKEGWRIFTGKFKVKDGQLKRCEPGALLAAGVDEGVWEMETGEFESYGTVDYASPRLRHWTGRTVYQDGVTGPGVSVSGVEDAFGLIGSLQLN